MTSPADTAFWNRCEQLILRDPAARGLASYRLRGEALGAGNLRRAATSLAGGRRLAIVTGFTVAEHQPPVAETDGPPGALYLAAAARRLGLDAVLVSDRFGLPLLLAGAEVLGLPAKHVVEFPFEVDLARLDDWIDALLAGRSAAEGPMTHLVAIERPGPSHTLESLLAQPRNGPAPHEAFEAVVPPGERDRCHNIRGRVIDEFTAPTHRLFEAAPRRPAAVQTIAAIDGGNEIGSGSFPWETLCRAITRGQPARVACRVPSDATVVAGVSDWGGYALALGMAQVLGRTRELAEFDCDAQRRLIETMVEQTGAVDGVTGHASATVDGLPLETYLQVLSGLREAVGLRG